MVLSYNYGILLRWSNVVNHLLCANRLDASFRWHDNSPEPTLILPHTQPCLA
jgi:hypothetical protein